MRHVRPELECAAAIAWAGRRRSRCSDPVRRPEGSSTQRRKNAKAQKTRETLVLLRPCALASLR